MATFSRIKQWVSNEVLTASDLNQEFDNIITNMTPSGVEDASSNVAAMQTTISPGGLGTESLATSLLGEITRLRYAIARFVKLDGSKKWYETPLRSFGEGELAVKTDDIEDGAVTYEKLEDLAEDLSDPCGLFSTAMTSPQDVTNLEVTITTHGRRVIAMLVHDNANANGYVFANLILAGTTFDLSGIVSIVQDGSETAELNFGYSTTGGGPDLPMYPLTSFSASFKPAAGSHTYKVQIHKGSGVDAQVGILNARLLVYEL